MKLEEEISQRKFRNGRHKLSVNLLYTYSWINGLQTRIFKSHGITSQQFNILRILRGRHPQPASIKLLKERMIDKMSDASRIVEKLRQKGLVARHTSDLDRRHVDVFITGKGLKVLGELDKKENDFDLHSKALTNQEVEDLNKLLDKLRG